MTSPASSTADSEAEARLLETLRAGDPAAFETLVRQYAGRMLAVARRFFPNDADAQDVVQEAMLSAFKAVSRFDGRSQLATWLHRIVVNAALMKVRTRQRHPEESIEDLLPTFQEDRHQAAPCARWENSAEKLEREETQQVVRQQIEKLPESYRTVLLLRDIEQHDTETVARMLDATPDAIKVRLHRARQALRTLLDPYFGGQPTC